MRELNKYSDLAVLLIRLASGFRLIWGTADNLISTERMLEFRDFLQVHGFPFPLSSAWVSVIFQFLAGASWMIGFKVRWSGLLMLFNFSVALVAVHWGDSYLNASPAIHLWVISLFLLTYGPGRWSIDARGLGRRR